jgi:peptide/nickel transport system permease protein
MRRRLDSTANGEPARVRRRAARRSALPFALPMAWLALLTALATIWLLPPAADHAAGAAAAPFLPPGLVHPLGTDDLGRDLWREVLRGLGTSLAVGVGVAGLALAIGIAVGLAAGLGSPLADELLMRGADVVASLPTLVVAILVAAVFGGSLPAMVLVLGLGRWPLVARLVRVEVASLREREFVLAARALGASPWHIGRVHVLPHALTPALAASGILFGGALVSEAALAFVGLGDPSVTSLGQLAANGFAFVAHAPWMWIAPVGAIVALTVPVAMLTDRAPAPDSMT